MSEQNAAESIQSPDGPEASDTSAPTGASATAKSALAEEALLNAAVAFAGRAVSAAQQGAAEIGEQASPALREMMVRQYLLETATLCLRRLAESYEAAAGEPDLAAVAALLADGAAKARDATSAVEALGDLALDLLDRLLEE